MIVYFPLAFFPLVLFQCSSCSKVLLTKKKLNSHIVNMHKLPPSCIICYKAIFNQESFCPASFVYLPLSFTCKICGKAFGRGDTSGGTRSSATIPRSLTKWYHCGKKVQPSWGYMEPATPQIHCKTNTWPSWYLRHIIHHLQYKVHLQGAHEEQHSPVGTWNWRCRGQILRIAIGSSGPKWHGRQGQLCL